MVNSMRVLGSMRLQEYGKKECGCNHKQRQDICDATQDHACLGGKAHVQHALPDHNPDVEHRESEDAPLMDK